jgi:hypothetical protein
MAEEHGNSHKEVTRRRNFSFAPAGPKVYSEADLIFSLCRLSP